MTGFSFFDPLSLGFAGGLALAVLMIFVYQLTCLANLMRVERSPVSEPIDRGIWAALIVFLPAGLGGWLYDLVVNGKRLAALYLFSLLLAVVCGAGLVLTNARLAMLAVSLLMGLGLEN